MDKMNKRERGEARVRSLNAADKRYVGISFEQGSNGD